MQPEIYSSLLPHYLCYCDNFCCDIIYCALILAHIKEYG